MDFEQPYSSILVSLSLSLPPHPLPGCWSFLRLTDSTPQEASAAMLGSLTARYGSKPRGFSLWLPPVCQVGFVDCCFGFSSPAQALCRPHTHGEGAPAVPAATVAVQSLSVEVGHKIGSRLAGLALFPGSTPPPPPPPFWGLESGNETLSITHKLVKP